MTIDQIHHGPSSLVYFIHRLATFIQTDICVVPKQAESLPCQTAEILQSCDRLQKSQQDYFLDLFWQWYHVVYPIIDEAEFRHYYDSLWHDDLSREASPLVDVMMAICVHFGSSYMAAATGTSVEFPGHDFYLRAQAGLSQQQASETAASISTVQTMFFSCIYLLAVGRDSWAYAMIATAIRTAQMLGLDQQRDHSNIGERLWNCLVTLDIHLSLHLGHPTHVHSKQADHHLTQVSAETAELIGPNYAIASSSANDVHWLTFYQERVRLAVLVSDINMSSFAACNKILDDANLSDFYGNPFAREKCARFLAEQMKRLDQWVEELPRGIKTPRLNGVAYSNDRSILDLSQTDPSWLQRQRLILELDYHCYCILLRRSFISFLPTPALGTLSSDNHCIACVNHAITVTNILHQVLNNTDILTRWHQVQDWQCNATFAEAAFACGYPICPATPSARKALAVSATVYDLLDSEEMSKLTRKLDEKAVEIIRAFTNKLGITTPDLSPPGIGNMEATFDLPSQTFLISLLDAQKTSALSDPTSAGDTALESLFVGEDATENLLWGDLMYSF